MKQHGSWTVAWVFATGASMVLAACGDNGGTALTPLQPTATPTRLAIATATPTRTPTRAPTPTPTVTTQVAGSVKGLVVVNRAVAPNAAGELGAPPTLWMGEPDSATFNQSLANADWIVEGADGQQGHTGQDGGFEIGALPPGRYTLQATKTLDGNLLPVTIPFAVGDDGKATVVAEVSWGLVKTTSTYTLNGVQVREVHGPYAGLLVTRDGRVSELGDGTRTLADPDGDGRFDVSPCLDRVSSCSELLSCTLDRFCQCVASCPFCDNCGLPGVCVPKGTQPPYACSVDGACTLPSDRCVCVPSCPDCKDCTQRVCLPSCNALEITAVTISGGPSQLRVGAQSQVNAIAQLSDGSQIDVTYLATWSSSDPQVAAVDSWGAVSARAVGTAGFTASIGGLSSAPWPVEVVERPTLLHISVQNQLCRCGPGYLGAPTTDFSTRPCILETAPRSDILPVPHCNQVVQVGGTLQFTAIGQFADGSYEDITKDVQWQVTPANVGDVTEGLFTGRQAGTAQLTATLGAVVSDATEVRVVTQPTVLSLSIYADNAVVTLASGAPVPGGVAIPCRADLPESDLCCCPGPMSADATAPCGCGYSITVLRGDRLQFHATAQYDTGDWREVTDEVTWRSDTPAAATIDAHGAMTAVQAGNASIDAVLGDQTSNPVGVRVVDHATLQSIYIYEDGQYQGTVVAKGDQRFYKATGNYDVGFTRDISEAATWRSSNDSVGGFDKPGVFTGRAAGTVQVWAELDGQQSNYVSLEVYETSALDYCDLNDINRAAWSDDYNRVTLESDCAVYRQPGIATLRYTVTETKPHGGVFDPCLDLYVYQGDQRIRTIREERCGDPFLPTSAPGRDAEALKYQLRAFWDLKDENGSPVPPGAYTIYGRFYLYYDPVVRLDVKVLSSNEPVPTHAATNTPGPAVVLAVGSTAGVPGDRTGFNVSLHTAGQAVAGAQNDVLFDTAVAVAATANGHPDCAVNSDIDKGATVFSFIPAGCTAGVDCKGIRALVFSLDNTEPIPDGAVLYTCQVAIPADTAAGRYPLIASAVVASDPLGTALPSSSTNGEIVVTLEPGPPAPATPTPTEPFPVCTPPLCNAGEVFFCPRPCPGGCGTICVIPTPTPTPEGWCVQGADCAGGATATSRDLCCTYSRESASPLPFTWCPLDQFDGATGKCAVCAGDPCSGAPGDAANQPPFQLSSLDERCDDQTGAGIVSGVKSQYDVTLKARSDIKLPAENPLTIRVSYRGATLTCYPAVIPPPGSTRPVILAQVGAVVHVEFVTAGGAFDEQFDTEIKGRAGYVSFSYSTLPDTLHGTYRPDLPGYEEVGIGFFGNFAGDQTNGGVAQFGRRPEHASEYIPVAQWATGN